MNRPTVVIAAIALAAAIYHIYFAVLRPFSEGEHAIIHVGFAAAIIGLTQVRDRRGLMRLLALACLLLSVAASFYLFSQAEDLEFRYGIGLTTPQIVAGIAIMAAVVLLCWLEWGVVIASLAVAALVYFFFGSYLPGPMKAASQPSFPYAMSFLITSGGSGLYGQITPISANIIFLFMLFGALLGATGVTKLFLELGNWLSRVVKGGAAVTCVVASALFGTVTGATVANVAITGAFTIPTMKRQGFRAQDAGAIEAVASCGGQVLPPVMGAGAFIMAAYLGVPYIEIAARALVPAVLFFVSVMLAILFLVRKRGGIEGDTSVDFAIIRQQVLPFLLPLGTLIYFLLQGFSASTAAVLAIGAVFATSLLRPSTWRSRAGAREAILSIGRGLIAGAKQGAGLAIVTAAISLVAQSLITTALGPKFASALAGLVGDNTLIALLLVMAASILLGCGLPTVAAYTMVAIMMVPALRNIGIDPGAAHMFVYYFAVYAAVTPPVATAAIVASRIAGASFWSTAWASMRLMIGPMIIPFMFIYHAEVMTFPPDPLALALPVLGWLIATIARLVFTVRYALIRTTEAERWTAFFSAGLAIAWIVTELPLLLAVAILLLATIWALQFRRAHLLKTT